MNKQVGEMIGISTNQVSNLGNDQWSINFNKENLGIHQAPNDLAQNYYEIIQAKLSN